ncbi:MAG: adenylyl-sulfate kinase [Rikenellaceae bacterium]
MNIKDCKEREIHPIFDRMLSREDREQQLGQRSVMIWFTGLSGSGKSTLAVTLERELVAREYVCRILDGDNIRSGINKNLGFSPEDREENIRRIAEVGKLFVDSGIITISAFISPTNDVRQLAREIIGDDNFMEIYVSTPIEECERRDVKGLYKKARAGVIKEFTGVSQPFEAPSHPAISINTQGIALEESIKRILKIVLPRVERI